MQTVQQEGVFGLTRGLGGTIARETPGNALFFTVYEVLISLDSQSLYICLDPLYLCIRALLNSLLI